MIFLSDFIFPDAAEESSFLDIGENWKVKMTCYDSYYPFNVLPLLGLQKLSFDELITLLYGNNGSGKTTILNIIARKIGLGKEALINETPFFPDYLGFCQYHTYDGKPIPADSKFISSDDVFDYMLNLRAVNQKTDTKRENLFEEYDRLRQKYCNENRPRHLDFDEINSIKTYETFTKNYKKMLRTSKSQFVRENLLGNIRERSNGESSLLFFQGRIESDALYLLDEPENSLSPEHQLELAKYIEDSAFACNCQFIIATHSPFLLAMNRSRIYDIDEYSSPIRKWTDLESIRLYKNFFDSHENDFD